MNLDDAVFELPSANLVRPHSIPKLEWDVDNEAQPAQEMVQEENDHGVAHPNLQREPSPGPREDSPPRLTNEYTQMILAQARDLGEFRDSMRYRFCGDSGSDNEPAPVDDSDDENEADEDAAEEIAGEYHAGSLDR